jgi:hypothetical protein
MAVGFIHGLELEEGTRADSPTFRTEPTPWRHDPAGGGEAGRLADALAEVLQEKGAGTRIST